MSDSPEHTVDDVDGLRTHYREPSAAVAGKAVTTVDPTSAQFIAASPFLVLATSSEDGADASPRGGPPGFVKVLDDGRQLAFADLSGNNRLDSYSNLVRHPEVGLIFFVPGSDDTVRVNGRASISTDASLRSATAIDEREPKVAVIIEVVECFIHCAKALRRAQLWDPEAWVGPIAATPTAGEILNNQHGLGLDPQLITDDLEKNYATTMWEPGGDLP